MNFFKIVMIMGGYPIGRAINDLRALQSLNVNDFDLYIEKKKWEQFTFHCCNNIFYNEFIKGHIIKEWKDIPILKKKDIQRPLNELLSKGFDTKGVFVNNTSGSSGTPLIFAKDKMAHARTWALVLDRYSKHGIVYGKSLQARFYGIPLYGIKYYKEKIKDILSARIRFSIFNLSDKELGLVIPVFKHKRFEYINGYTSSLVKFADYLIRNNLVLKDLCPTLKVCFPTSEMCSIVDRDIMVRGFGVPIANEYGCAEMDVLAFEDEDFDWIMSNENVYFEVVDDNDIVVKPGVRGRLLITSLHNKAMPLIRYEIGDIGVISPSKKIIKSILEELSGRSNEFAMLPSGKIVPALTFYYVTKSLIQSEIDVKELIVKQISLFEFHFEYISDSEIPEKLMSHVRESLEDYLEPGLLVTFERKQKIERTTAGKLKQFYNLIGK